MLRGTRHFRVIEADFYDNVMALEQPVGPWTKTDSSL
jgi:hypothetical protein